MITSDILSVIDPIGQVSQIYPIQSSPAAITTMIIILMMMMMIIIIILLLLAVSGYFNSLFHSKFHKLPFLSLGRYSKAPRDQWFAPGRRPG